MIAGVLWLALAQTAEPDSRVITDMRHERHIGQTAALCQSLSDAPDFARAFQGYVARHELTPEEVRHLGHDCAIYMLGRFKGFGKK